jgi:predicted DCC family thiol-disulfide oxidoreductase YuxK
MDPRTLGVFRLVHGFLLAADCVRHWKDASWAYSNEGVLSNHYNLFVTYHPDSYYLFSLYHAFSSLPEVHVAFALSVACYLCYCVGYKTRLFSILSFVLVTSMDSRLALVENGGYVVVNVLTCWAMFLPSGTRFSVDALLRSYRGSRERGEADLNERRRPAWASRPFVSIAALVATLNLAAIYYFNVVNKSGQIWRRGETVHYVLHLDRMVTGLGVLTRELLPLWVTKPMSWGVLTIEALIVMWILSPHGRRVTRPLAMLGMLVLHGALGVMMRLGPFSWFMIGWSLLLLTPLQWDGLERWYRRRAAARVVVYDGRSPLAFAIARLLARLDLLGLLRFEVAGAGATGGPPELLAARDPESGRVFSGSAALREIAQALPGGRWVWPVLSAATLGTAGRALAAAARRRGGLARFFGLGLPPSAPPALPSPLRQRLARVRSVAGEVVVVYLALCATSELINQNKSVPALLKHRQPRFVRTTLDYPRMHQKWDMFSANPITDDGILAVDAITADGRHVDPFTGQPPDLNLSDARGLGMGQVMQDYFNRIRLDHNKVYRKPQGLQEWLLRHHERTGRPEDEIVAFDVFWLRDQCPRPGETQPYAHEAIPILSYRKPNYRPPAGVPRLPPPLKEQSAGKM